VNWIHLGWDRVKWRALVNTATNFRVSWMSGTFWTGWATISFSRRTLLHAVSYIRSGSAQNFINLIIFDYWHATCVILRFKNGFLYCVYLSVKSVH
jgi:hypothetical protein